MNLPPDPQPLPEWITDVVRRLQAPDARTREAAAEQLIRGGADIVPALCLVLERASEAERIVACEALVRLRSAEAIPCLCRAAADPSLEVRKAAVTALASFEAGEVIEPLQALVERGDGTVVEAAELLAGLGDYSAFPALSQLRSRLSGRDRERILRALGRLGDPRAVPLLWESLVGGMVEEQVAAAEALCEISGNSAGLELAEGTDGLSLRTLHDTRRDALVRLGTARPGLLARLCVDPRLASPAAAEAVIRLGDRGERSLREVLRKTDHFDVPSRCRAVRVLSRMTENAIPLVRALSDPAPEVRAEAALALSGFRHPGAARALTSVFRNEQELESVKTCAALALVEQGTVAEELLERVADALSLERPLRERAAHTLVRVAESGALVDLNPAIRQLAGLSRSWKLSADERAIYTEALRQIRAAGDRLTDLPLPSEQLLSGGKSLPLPSAGSPSSAEALPRPSQARGDGE